MKAITVIVTDATNQPLPDCEVRFYGRIQNQRIDQRVTTSKEGKAEYCYEPLPIGYLRIEIRPEGKVPVHYSWDSRHSKIDLPQRLPIRLEPGFKLTGQVVDEAGDPVAGASVRISMPVTWPEDDNYYFNLASPVTDSRGQWRIPNAPEDVGQVSVRVSHEGYQPAGGRAARNGPPIVLRQGLEISGRVLNPDSEPVPGAVARLGPDRWGTDEPSATTDADGEFVLRNCDAGENVVTIQATGYAPMIRPISVGENNQPMRFKLEPPKELNVRVQDVNGQPIENAIVVVDGWQGYRTLEFRENTNRTGEVTWDSAPGDTVICDILKSGFMAARDTPLLPGDEVQTVTLYPELVISGRVIDRVAEKPVNSFRVIRGQNQTNLRQTYWRTQEEHRFQDGRFTFRIDEPMQSWLLRVEADGYKPSVSREFKSSEGEVRYHFLLEPAKQVSGRVVDESGSPVEDAEIIVATATKNAVFRNGRFDARSSAVEPVRSGADGEFTVTLPDDKFFLLIAVHDAGFAEVASTDMAESLMIRLSPWAGLAGDVKLGSLPDTGRAITYFAERPRDGRNYRSVEYRYETNTDQHGKFVLERVIPGDGSVSRIVVVENGQFTTHAPGWQTPVSLTPGQTQHVDIGGRGATVSGKLVLDREPPSGTAWRFESHLGLVHYDEQTGGRMEPYCRYVGEVDESGHFSIPDVPTGSYQLHTEVQAVGPQNRIAGKLGELTTVVTVRENKADLGEIVVPLDDTLEPGESMPRLTAETQQGQIVDSRKLRGMLVFLNFWSTYSDASLGETALLKSVARELSGDGRVVLISLSTAERVEAAWEEVRERGWDRSSPNWIQAYAGPMYTKLCQSFCIRKLPANFLIGPDGTVLAKDIDSAEILSKIQQQIEEIDFEVPLAEAESRFPITRFDRVADAATDQPHGPAALVLDDSDPKYELDDGRTDNLIALDQHGKEAWRLSGFEVAGGSAGSHRIAFDATRQRVYVGENVAKRITAVDLTGQKIWQVDRIEASCIALDEETGQLWVSGSNNISHGETVVLTADGDEVFSLPYRAVDMMYHPLTQQLWLVGKHLMICDRDGTLVRREPVKGHCYSSIAVDRDSGNVWIGERDHPDVSGSKNMLWLRASDGTRKKALELDQMDPFAVACLPSGKALFGGYRTGLLTASSSGQLNQIPPDVQDRAREGADGGANSGEGSFVRSLAVDVDGTAWVLTSDALLKLKNGSLTSLPLQLDAPNVIFAF